MPIVRTYACPSCNYWLEVTLTADQWDAPAPTCPQCAAWPANRPPEQMQQEFKPPAIGGSNHAKAVAIAENIAATDYNVADMHIEGYEGVRNKVRYKDQTPQSLSSWSNNTAAIEMAAASGRETRLKYGSGLDVIQTMPDLIKLSKQRSGRAW